jgi:hypothetical protein
MSDQTRTLVTSVIAVALLLGAFYLLDPTFGGLLRQTSGFTGNMNMGPTSVGQAMAGQMANNGALNAKLETNEHVVATPSVGDKAEGFADLAGYEGPAQFGNSEPPAGCYPRDQLTPSELLPKDPNSTWAQQNPMGTGSLKGKNFLSAGALIGVNTVGQSLRNGNYQFRSEPPNPQLPVSVWNQSTIEPDVNRRNLEVA